MLSDFSQESDLQKRKEKIIEKKRKEVERLEVECNKLTVMDYEHLREVPKPKYCRGFFCTCMNGGEGGFVTYE